MHSLLYTLKTESVIYHYVILKDQTQSKRRSHLPGNRILLSAAVVADSAAMGQSAAIKRTNTVNLEEEEEGSCCCC